jgi:hypothetical protein
VLVCMADKAGASVNQEKPLGVLVSACAHVYTQLFKQDCLYLKPAGPMHIRNEGESVLGLQPGAVTPSGAQCVRRPGIGGP